MSPALAHSIDQWSAIGRVKAQASHLRNGRNQMAEKKINQNSLANLKPPIQKGEMRNPWGVYGKDGRRRPYSGAIEKRGLEEVPEAIRRWLNRDYSRKIQGTRSPDYPRGSLSRNC